MNLLKSLILPLLLAAVFSLAACDQEIKEHPLPPSLKGQLQTQGASDSQTKNVSGTISIPSDLVDGLSKNPTLFIIARIEGAQGSAPLAVKRLDGVKFPYEYSIGQADAMMPGASFEGSLTLTARVDHDGFAGVTPGDIEGTVTAMAGDENKDIVLNQVIGAEPEPDGKSISGTIAVDPRVAEKISGKSALFIVLRAIGSAGGPPLAAQLHDLPAFPFHFTIGQKDAVMPNTTVEGKVNVIARVDHDGNATSSPGDVEGNRLARVGDTDIKIVLDRVVGEK